jgi:hypothetical protein
VLSFFFVVLTHSNALILFHAYVLFVILLSKPGRLVVVEGLALEAQHKYIGRIKKKLSIKFSSKVFAKILIYIKFLAYQSGRRFLLFRPEGPLKEV